ncbi:50S ribosomal protein L4 [Zancudomyces culisetae]|uniref:Large ribosomal subunit protein uL4m n=1 Tax=Zancudomyces culisetae TaxID=1213189 RepID=A0A1R1PNU9_ZANCU|nr:50S ribosomal protein L4 [Zancudomyces culisetae]|eukprot:OMH82621.1 50S ribosomal protein L4 [Zancudomyces culisetae]
MQSSRTLQGLSKNSKPIGKAYSILSGALANQVSKQTQQQRYSVLANTTTGEQYEGVKDGGIAQQVDLEYDPKYGFKQHNDHPLFTPQPVYTMVQDINNPYTPVKMIALDSTVFNATIRGDILHRCVTYERNSLRQGTHSTKTISDIRGSAKKQASQKGRGKARIGTHRAPQFRTGAVAHGPQPQSHATELQRKVWQLGFRSLLSAKFLQNELVVFEDLKLANFKTRDFVELMHEHGLVSRSEDVMKTNGHMMVLTDAERQCSSESNELKNLQLACRNILGIKMEEATDALLFDILRHKYLAMDLATLRMIEERLKVF